MSYVDVKFIGLLSSQLDQFKQKTNNLYNFRCPICGDSERNRYKARGYLYPSQDSDGYIFKCHNCGDTRSLGNLIKFLDHNLYQKYLLEGFGKDDNRFVVKKKKKTKMTFGPPKFSSIDRLLKIGAIKLNKCDISHTAIRFADSRKIPSSFFGDLYYLDDEEKLEKLSDKYRDRIVGHDSRMLIPYYDENDALIGVTGRAIDPKNKLRYLTLKLIYGMNRVNKRERIYVVEGPIDSLFIPNGIAVSGSDFSKLENKVEKDLCTIIFDNEPRNKEVVKKMKKIIDEGYDVCVWPEFIEEKDVNDMILAGRTSDEIIEIINSNTFSGLKAVAALSNWKRVLV